MNEKVNNIINNPKKEVKKDDKTLTNLGIKEFVSVCIFNEENYFFTNQIGVIQ